MSSILRLMKMTRPEAIQLSGRSSSERPAPPAGPYPADFEPGRLLSSYVLDDEPPEFILDDSFPPPPPAEEAPRPRRPRGAAAIPQSFLSLLCMFAIAGGIAIFPARVGNVRGAVRPAGEQVDLSSFVAPLAEKVYVAAAVIAQNPGDAADSVRQAAPAMASEDFMAQTAGLAAQLNADPAVVQAAADSVAGPPAASLLPAETVAPPLEFLPAPATAPLPAPALSLAPGNSAPAALALDAVPTVLPTDVHPAPFAAAASASELAVADAFRAVALELQPIALPEPADEYLSAAPLPAPGATEVLSAADEIPLATADAPVASRAAPGTRRASTRAAVTPGSSQAAIARANRPAPASDRVEGIFYDKVRPMALIGGQIVETGASAAGGTVVAINPTSVVINRNGREITLAP